MMDFQSCDSFAVYKKRQILAVSQSWLDGDEHRHTGTLNLDWPTSHTESLGTDGGDGDDGAGRLGSVKT